jgi:hypothetical protein
MEIAYKKMYSFQDLLEKYRDLCDLEFTVLGHIFIGHIFIGKLTRVWVTEVNASGFLYFTNEATGREVSVRRYHEKGKIYLDKYDNGKDVEIQDMFEVFQK